jgi:hypothetical protein
VTLTGAFNGISNPLTVALFILILAGTLKNTYLPLAGTLTLYVPAGLALGVAFVVASV